MKMKNYIAILWIALNMMGVFSACTDNDSLMAEQKPMKKVAIRATINGDFGSRVALTDDAEKRAVKVEWAEGDAFKINVNGQDYTFTYNTTSQEFDCSDPNIPEYFNSDATITAIYPAELTSAYNNQPGTLEGAAALLTMEATIAVTEGQSTDNLTLDFEHKNSIVKLTLSNDAFKGKSVKGITLKSGSSVTTATNTFTGDATTGSIVTYFAVVPQAMSNISILATCEDDDYTAKLTNKTLQAGNLYNVSKQLEIVVRPAAFNIADAQSFALAIKRNIDGLTKLRFVTKSDQTSNVTVSTDNNSIMAYAIKNGDWMEIHTSAKTFMLPESCINMFNGSSALTEIDMRGLNTSNVTNMKAMFMSCSNLVSLNLSNFNTEKVTTMNQMFSACSKLSTLNLGVNFNTEKVTNMSSMFSSCNSLTSLDLSIFNTSNVTTMGNMFANCKSLTTLNLGVNFNTEKVTEMSYMFYNCSKLVTLNLGVNFNTEKVTDMSNMFSGCSSLTSLDLSNFNTSSVQYMSSMFYNCSKLVTLNLGVNFNTSSVTSMYQMFYGCSCLTSLDLSNFNTTNVPSLKNMFNGCSSLTTLTLGVNFNTEKVTDMSNMFWGCSSLTSLDLSNFNTSNVTTMQNMFYNCKNLPTLTLGDNFDTSSVNNMDNMFSGCSKLTSLDLSNFNTEKVSTMSSMFSDCSSLTTFTFGKNFKTSNVMGMGYMFNGCSSLTSLDLSNFDTSSVKDMKYMFYKCSQLTSLDLSSFVINDGVGILNIFSYVGNSLTDSKTKIYVNADNKSKIQWSLDNSSVYTKVELVEKTN